MASSRLPNYLLTNRKRLALSQADVAFLLGTRGGTKMCRYERFVRVPSLETALALEVIFQKPARELFAGLYQKIEGEVAARAKAMTYRTDMRKPDRETTRKRQVLTNIATRQLNQTTNQS
jgi:transcriptional regulator with XRE-family HTH domain